MHMFAQKILMSPQKSADSREELKSAFFMTTMLMGLQVAGEFSKIEKSKNFTVECPKWNWKKVGNFEPKLKKSNESDHCSWKVLN